MHCHHQYLILDVDDIESIPHLWGEPDTGLKLANVNATFPKAMAGGGSAASCTHGAVDDTKYQEARG